MTIILWWVFSIESSKSEFKSGKSRVLKNGDPDTGKEIYIDTHTHTHTFLMASYILNFKSHFKSSIWKGKQGTFLQITCIEMSNLFFLEETKTTHVTCFLTADLWQVFCVDHDPRSITKCINHLNVNVWSHTISDFTIWWRITGAGFKNNLANFHVCTVLKFSEKHLKK